MNRRSLLKQKRDEYRRNKSTYQASQRIRYRLNRTRYRKEQRDYYLETIEARRAYQRDYRASGRRAELLRTLTGCYQKYKDAAKRRGIPFTLTKADFEKFWMRACHYCGDLIETIGLDRVNNKRGYTMKNVVPCCKWCNYAKNNGSVAQFIAKCRKVVERCT